LSANPNSYCGIKEADRSPSQARGFLTQAVDNPIMLRVTILTVCLLFVVDARWFDSKYTVAFVQMTSNIARSFGWY
jgi:hypothetical protein